MANMPVHIGSLRHRIQVQSATVTSSAAGNVKAWATVANGTRWASIEPLRGFEAMQGMQADARVTHRIAMRYLSGVTPSYRVLFGSRVFHIRQVRDMDERRTWQELIVEEDANG